MQGFASMLGNSDMLAYLSMMAPRLIELHRVLKPTGSIYLHCDPTASHYLKLLLDAVFDPINFGSEIVWRRTGSHNSAKRYGPIHDIIFYSRKDRAQTNWNRPKHPYATEHVENNFEREGHRWRTRYYGNVLSGSGTRNGESGAVWRGFDPTAKGRHWAIPGKLVEEVELATGEQVKQLKPLAKLEKLYQLGYITIEEGKAWPEYSHFIDPTLGVPASDLWTFQPYTAGHGIVYGTEDGIDEDVRWLSPKDQERLGYPTQKPEGLLERIIKASSNEGDVVLDPFCGCGTAVAVAQKLNRRWIGIDVTHLAVNLIKHRLQDSFNIRPRQDPPAYDVVGEPTGISGAKELAHEDRFQFQAWALGLVGARVTSSNKRGADKGVDGRLFFSDEEGAKAKVKQVVLSVKSGKVGVRDVRDLVGVLDREAKNQGVIGVLITLEKPTKPMIAEAAGAGLYDSPWGTKHARVQVLTVEGLLNGTERIGMPPTGDLRTFKKAPKQRKPGDKASGQLF